MANFNQNLGLGPEDTTVQKSVYAKQQSPGQKLFQQVATNALQGAAAGAAQQVQVNRLNQAVQGSGDAAGQGAIDTLNTTLDTSSMTKEQYQAAAGEYLSSVKASAATLDKAARQGKISDIYAESEIRRRVNGIKSNPILSHFANQAQGIAGIRGGGNVGDGMRINDPAFAAIAARNEARAAAEAKVTEEVATMSSILGVSEEAARGKLRERQLHQEQKMRIEQNDISGQAAVGVQINEMGINFEDTMYAMLKQSEDRLLDFNQLMNLEAQAGASLNELTGQINADPTLSRAAKDQAIAAAKLQMQGNLSTMKLLSRDDRNKAAVASFGTDAAMTQIDLDPLTAYLKATGQDEELKALIGRDSGMREAYGRKRWGDSGYERIVNQAKGLQLVSAKDILREGKPAGLYQPAEDPVILADEVSVDQAAKVLTESDEATKNKIQNNYWKQANEQPANTLARSLEGGVMRKVREGDLGALEMARPMIRGAVDKLQAIAVETGAPAGAISVSRKTGRGSGANTWVINGAEYLPGGEEAAEQLFHSLRQAPQLWPAGATSPMEAFAILLDTTADPNGALTPAAEQNIVINDNSAAAQAGRGRMGNARRLQAERTEGQPQEERAPYGSMPSRYTEADSTTAAMSNEELNAAVKSAGTPRVLREQYQKELETRGLVAVDQGDISRENDVNYVDPYIPPTELEIQEAEAAQAEQDRQAKSDNMASRQSNRGQRGGNAEAPEVAPTEAAPTTEGDFVEQVIAELPTLEGRRGDTVTDTPTEGYGLTTKLRKDLEKLGVITEDMDDLERAGAAVRHFDSELQKLPGYADAPTSLKRTILDLAYNLGSDKVGTFKKMKQYLEAGKPVKAARETLDSANAEGKFVMGLGKRRALGYNNVAAEFGADPITKIEYDMAAKRASYIDEDGDVVSSYEKPISETSLTDKNRNQKKITLKVQ